MKKILRFLATLSIGLTVFFILLQKIGWSSVEEAIFLFLSWQGVIVVLLTFLFAFISIIRWRFIIKKQGKEISFWDTTKFWFSGFAMSYFTPVAFMGGEAARVVALRKIKKFSWKESIVSVGIDKIFDGTIFLIFLLIGIVVFSILADFSSSFYTIITWSCVGILATGLFIFYFKRKEGPAKWFLTKALGIKAFENSKNTQAFFEAEKDIGKFFSYKKLIFWQGIGFSVLKYLVSFLRIILVFYFVAKEWNIFNAMSVYGFYNLSLFFSMPAALGSLEGAGALVFNALGYGLAKGIVFAFFCRGADLVLAFSGLYFLVKLGFNILREKILKYTEII